MKPLYDGTSIYRRAKGLSKSVRYNEVSLYRVFSFSIQLLGNLYTVEPRYIEGPRDCQNLFVITRFRYIECFHLVYYYWGKKNTVRYADDNTQLFLSFLLNFHFTFFICYFFGSEFLMSKIKSMKLLLGPVYMEVGDPM